MPPTTKKAVVFTSKSNAALSAPVIAPTPKAATPEIAPVQKPRGSGRYFAVKGTIEVPARSFVVVLPLLPVKLSEKGISYTLAADSGETDMVMPGTGQPVKFTASVWSKRVYGYAVPNESKLEEERAARQAKANKEG